MSLQCCSLEILIIYERIHLSLFKYFKGIDKRNTALLTYYVQHTAKSRYNDHSTEMTNPESTKYFPTHETHFYVQCNNLLHQNIPL